MKHLHEGYLENFKKTARKVDIGVFKGILRILPPVEPSTLTEILKRIRVHCIEGECTTFNIECFEHINGNFKHESTLLIMNLNFFVDF